MGRFVSLMVIIMVLSATAMAITTYVEDFEAPDVVGNPPTPTAAPTPYWEDFYVGGYFSVPIIAVGEGTNFSQVYYDPGYPAYPCGSIKKWVFTTPAARPQVFTFDFDVMGWGVSSDKPLTVTLMDNDYSEERIQPGMGTWGHLIVGIIFDRDQVRIFDVGGSTQPVIGTWQEYQWQHVSMTVDTVAKSISVSLDGGPAAAATYTPEDGMHLQGDTIWFRRADQQAPPFAVDNLVMNIASFAPPPATIRGTVVPGDYSGDLTLITVNVEFRKNGVPVYACRRTLDADGQFTVDDVTQDTYDIAIKSYAHLRKVLTNVAVNNVPVTNIGPITLINGDTDGDNEVTTSDLATVLVNMDLMGE